MNPIKADTIHFVCYKWGNRYTYDDVNKLYSMVCRNYTGDFEFHCVTDDRKYITEEVIVHDLEHNIENRIINKLQSFSRNFLSLNGRLVVSLDLDLVIVDNIDFLADHPDLDFMVARDGVRSERLHGAVYRIRVGSSPHVWENLITDLEGESRLSPERTDREQHWLEMNFPEPHFFPEGKIVSFKYNCGARSWRAFGPYGARIGVTTSHFGSAQLPPGAAIVSFHGTLMPKYFVDGRYMEWKRAPFVNRYWRTD